MIGPVSGTGRTMMASLQQAMSKGMPPDQAIQYVKSMATQGVAPLADLYAMMKQFERLKQQPVQPPQTPPTIRDELNMMEQQQMMGGMPPQMMGAGPQMPGGGGGPQMPPQMPQQMPPQMAQGLGAINAGAMENPSFAGGGIVAFQEGGGANSSQNTESEFTYLKRLQQQALAVGDIETARNIQKSIDAALEGSMARARQKAISGIEDPLASGLDVVRQSLGMGRYAAGRDSQPVPQATPTASAVPSAENPFGGNFQDNLALGRQGVRQDVAPTTAPPPAPAPRRELSMPSMSGFKRMEVPVAKSRDAFYEELKAAQQKEGIGEAARKREEYLTNEENRLKKEYGSDKMLAFAEAGFKMAGAASRPGATFFGALAEGAMSGTQALRALNKEQRASRRAMDEARFQLAEAAEQRKLGNMKDATILAEKAKDRFDQAQKYNMELENDIQKLRITTGTQLKAAEIAAGERAESRALAGKSFQLEGLRAQVASAEKRLAQANRSLEPNAAAKVAEIEREIAFYNDQIAKLGGTTSYAGAGTGNIIDFSSLP